MQTIELNALENVTGGRKVPKVSTMQKVIGHGMEVMNFGFNAMMGLELVNMGVDAYHSIRGTKSTPATPAKPAQPAIDE